MGLSAFHLPLFQVTPNVFGDFSLCFCRGFNRINKPWKNSIFVISRGTQADVDRECVIVKRGNFNQADSFAINMNHLLFLLNHLFVGSFIPVMNVEWRDKKPPNNRALMNW